MAHLCHRNKIQSFLFSSPLLHPYNLSYDLVAKTKVNFTAQFQTTALSGTAVLADVYSTSSFVCVQYVFKVILPNLKGAILCISHRFMDIPSNSDDHYGDFESSSDEEEWSSSDDSLISDMGAAAAILGSTRRSQWVLPVDNRKKKRPRAEPEIMPRPPNILHQLRFRECQHKFKRKHMHIQKWPAHTYFLGQVAGARGCVNALKWSLNGEILVSAGDDTVVRLHRFRSGFSSAHGPQLVSKMSEHVTEHFDNIFSCILLERDQLVVSSSRSGQVFMYDPTRGNLVRAFRFGEGSKLACRPYSQPSAFWSCSHNGLVVQHDIRAGAEAARGGSHIVGQAMTEINCRHMVRGSTVCILI